MSVEINGSAGVTTNTGAVYDGVQSQTAKNSTSGTSVDFTSIPSWVKRVTVAFSGVSTSGTSSILVQIGAGSVVTSGYASGSGRIGGSTVAASTSTAGYIVTMNSASAIIHGTVVLLNIGSNTWVCSISLGDSNGATSGLYGFTGGGSVALSGALDRVRITTVNGTDTFDAGSINILYE